MDYIFDDTIDVKLITLFIADAFKMPVPESCMVDVIMVQPVVNYFDLAEHLAELVSGGYMTYYVENSERFYDITQKGREALTYFSKRIPQTVRERLLRTVKMKVKELKNSIGIRAGYEKISSIEYCVSLGITEGASDLFSVSLSVGDEIMAKRMCAEFKKDPQALYSEILSVLIKDNTL